jgi:FMN phosphatase YigB (HAD superfamily)
MNKTIRAVLFDLDDTLLENSMDRFLKAYFGLLTPNMAHLIPPEKFISAF